MLALAAVSVTAGCDGDDGWSPEAQFAPSLQPAFGARVTDGRLRIWTGTPCTGVTRLALTFDADRPDRADLVLTAPDADGAPLEHFTLGDPSPGLEVSEPLPHGYDWRRARTLRLVISASRDGWGSNADLGEVTDGSPHHPADTYWFQDIGWLDAAGVAEQDGKTFLTTCSSDPAKA
ncbi:hypothetical protein ACWDTP_23625 [Mycobacterium sp. NPDC003449]